MNKTDNGPILVTGAAGQLGAVGRTVTKLLLERGLPVRALVWASYTGPAGTTDWRMARNS
jgi:nucleoside-diphosphate-sugar epimerase